MHDAMFVLVMVAHECKLSVFMRRLDDGCADSEMSSAVGGVSLPEYILSI